MSVKMINFRLHTVKSSLYILFSLGAISSIWLAFVPAYGVEFYSKDESPFGISNSDWVAKFWNWDFSLLHDPQTNQVSGLNQNGCLIHKENSMVMLSDTSVGGVWNQNCTISRNDGILISIWTGECNTGENDCRGMSLEELSKAARNYDLGQINGLVKVDNILVAELDVLDYKNIKMNNVTEVYTKQFNATIPINSEMKTDEESYGKTFPGAAHGWFVFLKPLQPGNHTVYYQNSVTDPTATDSTAANVNTAQFTYLFKVE
jgi:hypothetical protein